MEYFFILGGGNLLFYSIYVLICYKTQKQETKEQRVKELLISIPCINLIFGCYIKDIALIASSVIIGIILLKIYSYLFKINFLHFLSRFISDSHNIKKSMLSETKEVLVNLVQAALDGDAEAQFLFYIAIVRKGTLKLDYPKFLDSHGCGYFEKWLHLSSKKNHLDAKNLLMLSPENPERIKDLYDKFPISIKKIFFDNESFYDRLKLWQTAQNEKKVKFKTLQLIATEGQGREHPKSSFLLGYCYLFGIGVKVSYDAAAQLFEKLGQDGHSESQYILGCMAQQISTNPCSGKSNKIAYMWTNLSAANGNDCAYKLRDILEKKIGNSSDILFLQEKCRGRSFSSSLDKIDIEKLKRDVRAGDPAALYELGVHYIGKSTYEKSRIMPQDEVKGIELIRKAAEKKYPLAQYRMAQLYANDNPVLGKKDIAQAIKWYELAIQQNIFSATKDLAKIYADPNLSHCDPKKAFECFRQSAERDDAEAQYYMSCYYFTGEHIAQNFVTGQSWLQRAAENNHYIARKYLNSRWKLIDLPHQDSKFIANNIEYYWLQGQNIKSSQSEHDKIKSFILCHPNGFRLKILYIVRGSKPNKHITILAMVQMNAVESKKETWLMHSKISSKSEAEKFFNMVTSLLVLYEENLDMISWFIPEYPIKFVHHNHTYTMPVKSEQEYVIDYEYASFDIAKGKLNNLPSQLVTQVEFIHSDITDNQAFVLRFVNCRFIHVSFTESLGRQGVVFENCEIFNCSFDNINLNSINFNNCKIKNISFTNSQTILSDKIAFHNCIIDSVQFSKHLITYLEFYKTSCQRLKFYETDVPVIDKIYTKINSIIADKKLSASMTVEQNMQMIIEKIINKKLELVFPMFQDKIHRCVTMILVYNSSEPFGYEIKKDQLTDMINNFSLNELAGEQRKNLL